MMMNCECQPLAFAPFTVFTGNMDVMVSQVRRSVVSVVQQYSHIRYPCLFDDLLYPLLMHDMKIKVSNKPLPISPSVVCTCLATLLGLTWLQWSSPLTGRSTASLLRLKVKSIK